MSYDTPILFLIFNRPDLTEQVFNRIKEIKPKKLFVAADGPRFEKEDECFLCKKTRNVVINNIDWDCDVKYLFRANNLGCGLAVSGAITWFFEHVTEGIILEDDCLVDVSFFYFAQAMLSKYRYSSEVYHISSLSFLKEDKSENDFDFVKYPLIWGWATWRRCWNNYSFELDYREVKTVLKKLEVQKQAKKYWYNIFKLLEFKKIDTWDYQWLFCCISNKGLCIIPKKNMVSNIGFDDRGTHTKNPNNRMAGQQIFRLDNWERYPKLKENKKKSISIERDIFEIPSYSAYLRRKIRNKILYIYRKYIRAYSGF